MFLFLLSVREIFWLKNILLISTSRRNVCHKGHFKFSFFEYIGCMGLSFLDLIVIWHMVYAIIPNMVHTFINQPFKIFRVPVISVKTHGHALLLLPLSKKFFASLPPLKIAIFWLNIYPSIFDFSSSPNSNLIDYNCDYVFIPYSF